LEQRSAYEKGYQLFFYKNCRWISQKYSESQSSQPAFRRGESFVLIRPGAIKSASQKAIFKQSLF
jgi:hypothetical protein